MNEEEYNGWTNRETWALKLHWDNEQDVYKYFTEEAKQQKTDGVEAWRFGEWLREEAETIYHNFLFGDVRHKEVAFLISDVGSLWRVNWDELAKAYYDEVEAE